MTSSTAIASSPRGLLALEHLSPGPLGEGHVTGAGLRRWLFADQLGPHFLDSEDQPVLLVEARSVFRRRSFHRQKAHLVLSALRHRAAELGDRARFHQGETYREALNALGERVSVCAPTSRAADRFVRGLDGVEVLPARGFTMSRRDFSDWAEGRRRLLLEDFYREQRRRHGVLMEGGEPTTGRWNYDADNRERPPRGANRLDVVPPWQPDEDEIDEQVRRDLDSWEAEGAIRTVGRDGPRRFAVTREEALTALRHFVEHRLPAFGPFEDAMLAEDRTMAHSLLSAPLNLGLLDPMECVRAAEEAYLCGAAPLRSVEGYVRQVLGWREYVWHTYWHFGPDYRQHNALGAGRRLPRWFAELDADAVEARCLSTVLAQVRGLRLDPSHPATDGSRQLRPATRVESARAHRLVPPLLRRRLRLGHASQRARHVAARGRRADGDQAVRRRRRVHQPDERPLRRLPIRAAAAARGRCLSLHCGVLVVPAP